MRCCLVTAVKPVGLKSTGAARERNGSEPPDRRCLFGRCGGCLLLFSLSNTITSYDDRYPDLCIYNEAVICTLKVALRTESTSRSIHCPATLHAGRRSGPHTHGLHTMASKEETAQLKKLASQMEGSSPLPATLSPCSPASLSLSLSLSAISLPLSLTRRRWASSQPASRRR